MRSFTYRDTSITIFKEKQDGGFSIIIVTQATYYIIQDTWLEDDRCHTWKDAITEAKLIVDVWYDNGAVEESSYEED